MAAGRAVSGGMCVVGRRLARPRRLRQPQKIAAESAPATVGKVRGQGSETPGGVGNVRGRRTDMHAVIKTGGKQYRVAPGDTVKVETLSAEVGQQVTLSEVLAVSNGDDVKVGAPFVAGASVVATVVGHGRHDKVTIFKMRRRKHFQKHGGHRQNFTELRIDSIA
jgi:large subunit ribosomal protein L21